LKNCSKLYQRGYSKLNHRVTSAAVVKKLVLGNHGEIQRVVCRVERVRGEEREEEEEVEDEEERERKREEEREEER